MGYFCVTQIWLNLFGITYIEHGSRWALLILAVISTLAMATISNARIRRNHKYQIGYHGPVNLTPASDVPIHRDRIEPTIAGQKSEELHLDISQVAKQYTVVHDIQASTANLYQSQQNNWEQQLGRWFIANRKISIIAISTILCITLIVVILPVFENQPEPIVETKQAKIDTKKVRLNKIEMPDQFWMMLDQNDSLTIAWEGDFKTDAELEPEGSYWSASTGKGDKDCVDLHFSLGENIRTLLVTVKNGGDYYADFSPVDTETIVKSIAGKDRFKLCGYEFTLKGTRSLLRKNKKYTQFLKID